MYDFKSIILYSKWISIELSGMKEVARHFEDLEYLNTINIQCSKILSNVTTLGYLKLDPLAVMEFRLGRSTKQIISNQFIFTSKCQ